MTEPKIFQSTWSFKAQNQSDAAIYSSSCVLFINNNQIIGGTSRNQFNTQYGNHKQYVTMPQVYFSK